MSLGLRWVFLSVIYNRGAITASTWLASCSCLVTNMFHFSWNRWHCFHLANEFPAGERDRGKVLDGRVELSLLGLGRQAAGGLFVLSPEEPWNVLACRKCMSWRTVVSHIAAVGSREEEEGVWGLQCSAMGSSLHEGMWELTVSVKTLGEGRLRLP